LIYIIFLLFIVNGCNQKALINPEEKMFDLEIFKAKEKFYEDNSIFYPGISDPSIRPILNQKINLAADDFMVVSLKENPTELDYQEKIKIGLERFSDIYDKLDTEDRERICLYFEELMDIVNLESSGGLLNNFMYGFDPN